MGCGNDSGLELGSIGDVTELERSAQVARRLLSTGFTVGDGDPCPKFDEPQRDRGTDALAAAGDQNVASGEIELGEKIRSHRATLDRAPFHTKLVKR